MPTGSGRSPPVREPLAAPPDALFGPALVEAYERESRRAVYPRLARHRDDKRVWEKYRWVAEYHNDFVRRQADDVPELLVPGDDMAWRFAPFA